MLVGIMYSLYRGIFTGRGCSPATILKVESKSYITSQITLCLVIEYKLQTND